MRILTISFLVATMTLTSCGGIRDSRVNPLNWFGSAQSGPVQQTAPEEINPLIPDTASRGLFDSLREQADIYVGTPVDQIKSLVVEAIPGGAIIRVTGVTDVLGVYDVRLTKTNEDDVAEDGVLTYQLQGIRPARATRGGTERTRTVVAARRLSASQLAGTRVIRVEGLRNAQTTARR